MLIKIYEAFNASYEVLVISCICCGNLQYCIRFYPVLLWVLLYLNTTA